MAPGPGKFVKGTKMVYSVPDEKDRQDVIAYLRNVAEINVWAP
jgi:cytochrome c